MHHTMISYEAFLNSDKEGSINLKPYFCQCCSYQQPKR